ncbi:hypothetical protein HanPSC8_Chr12g0512841 [Helianthus annuus]|nr:hypothetical protein HanPSC8_Chr12g0512841 [Helianthus annuus]
MKSATKFLLDFQIIRISSSLFPLMMERYLVRKFSGLDIISLAYET